VTSAAVGPLDLVDDARDLIRDDRASTAGIWPRAAAVLARQGIEFALSNLWQLRAPGLEYTPFRCQLLCLPAFLGDDGLAERTSLSYWALSRALHHHPYELAPTHSELEECITTAWELGNRVADIEKDAAGRRT
jgi:hypothetical protein